MSAARPAHPAVLELAVAQFTYDQTSGKPLSEIPEGQEGVVPFTTVSIQLAINGVKLLTAIDLTALVVSCFREYDQTVLTCSCGHSGCNRIEDPIGIEHPADRLLWHVPTNAQESTYQAALKHCGFPVNGDVTTLSFDKDEYTRTVHAAAAELIGVLYAAKGSFGYGFASSADEPTAAADVIEELTFAVSRHDDWEALREERESAVEQAQPAAEASGSEDATNAPS